MAEINKQIMGIIDTVNQRMSYYPLWAFDALKKGEIDIMCSTAGAPLGDTHRLLASGKFGLMSIDPSMIATIIEKYRVDIRMADFKHKYYNTSNISTIGSYAFLVASKDIPNSDILELLTVLDNSKDIIRKKIDLHHGENFQLDEFNFLDSFKAEHDRNLFEQVSDLIIFLFSIVVATAISMSILVWIVSSLRQNWYLREISSVVKISLPGNTELKQDEDDLYPVPVVPSDCNETISKLVTGVSSIYAIRLEVNEDYKTGSITDNHHLDILDHLYEVKERMQHVLAQYFSDAFRSEKPIPLNKLRRYYMTGYLLKEDFIRLREIHYPKEAE